MGVNFNIDQMRAVSDASTGTFADVKGMFGPLRAFCDNSGDNPAVDAIMENAAAAEKSFNDVLLPAFDTLKQGVRTYCDNVEAWDKSMKNMEPLSLAAVNSTSVDNKIKPVDMN